MTLRKKLFWISILYFAEGLPFGIVYDVLPVYFRQNGVSLKDIGFMFFLTLPWTVKVLWSPLIDRFGERRTWVTLCCAAMASVMIAVPLFEASQPTLMLWLVLLAFTLASSTQDIAIDAYAIGLLSKGEEGVANGYRLALYRVAVLLGGGGTMFLVKPLGWVWIFILLALAFVALAFFAWASPTVPVVHEPPREWARHFWAFLSRPGSIAIFVFVLTYRMGELFMMPMVKPFWVDRGMSPEEIGKISTIAGTILGILGTLAGGIFTTRYGLFRGLWILGLVQAVPNLAYAAVAHFSLDWPYLYGASMFESFSFGLGTGAFFAFLMRICDKNQAATQYALLTSVFGLGRIFGGWSGMGVEHFGYAGFFVLTFVLSLPCYILLPWVRRWIGGNGDGHGSYATAGAPPAVGVPTADPDTRGARRTPASAPAR
ncbi:MAG TPA: MFS transporter [Candidatus Polarisedimenticolia bacterium]|nr:MFS transporter [Candidatus Polarisedimenticolia bacterium]